MWKKAISFFLLGLALEGCGNNNNEAIEDSRLTPEVKEEMMEESHPGIPDDGELNGDSRINNENRNNEGRRPIRESTEMDGNR